MEEYHLVEGDIINKEYFENIRNIVICSICLNIIEEPIFCNQCQYNFCIDCIKKLSRCPMGCQNYQFVPGQLCEELLSGIKIKCECDNEISYNDIKKHKEEECKKINFKERYLNLKKEYNLLKEEINNPKELDDVPRAGCIKSLVHKHIIQIMRHFNNSWTCDICENSFDKDIPSYNCTLCDFDVCYNCVKDKITKGIINDEMKNFYFN